jgi:hypothetical protein
MRAGHANQQQYGGQRGEQDILEYPQQQHTAERDCRGIEIEPADAPHVQQLWKVHQSVDRPLLS